MGGELVWHWKGKPVSAMTRDELASALVVVMERVAELERKSFADQEREMARLFDVGRHAVAR